MLEGKKKKSLKKYFKCGVGGGRDGSVFLLMLFNQRLRIEYTHAPRKCSANTSDTFFFCSGRIGAFDGSHTSGNSDLSLTSRDPGAVRERESEEKS